MESENNNKLPEGVGKRIIENLKNQEFEVNYDEEVETETVEQENIAANDYPEEEELEEEFSVQEEPETEYDLEIESDPIDKESSEISCVCSVQAPVKDKKHEEKEVYRENEQKNAGFSDIDTLLNLISQLPSGVTKQTGALIIRQTLEAMGISMNKVLGDAQSVQEGLENSIRNNVNIIEEYKTKIKILEQEIHKFRKKAHDLEDIISLFILSEDKK